MKTYRDDRGFTLIEILVACTIMGLVMGAIISVFTSSNRSYIVQEEVVEMQETGRFLTEYLAQKLRMAGYDPREANDPTRIFKFQIPSGTVPNPEFPTVNYGNQSVTCGTINYNGTGSPNDVMIAFTLDDNEDGALNDTPGTPANWNPDELVAIVYDPDAKAVVIFNPDKVAGSSPWSTLVDNIIGFNVTYIYANKQTSDDIGMPDDTDANYDNDSDKIRSVEIEVRVQQRNALFGQARRQRDYMTRVRCRNLGL